MKSLKRFILEIKGFTLIELIIVIAIFGIILSISLPKNIVSNYKLQLFAKELTSDIRQTRYLKMTKGHQYAVFIGDDYYFISRGKKKIKQNKTEHIRLMQDFKGSIVFSYNGSPKVGGTLRVLDEITNESYKITIVPFTGRILLQREIDI